MDNTETSLDLYAKVEDLLGVKESAPALYAHYLLFLQSHSFDTLLDVGCGTGDFLRQMQQALNIAHVKGIDLSPMMVFLTKKQGIEASCVDLSELEGKYDVITAVFDMVNYVEKDALQAFLSSVKIHLHEGGYFLCDINTLYGFENVAVGAYIVDDDKRFLTVDSDFEKELYTSEFTLFEKEGSCFKKSQETITQHYHTVQALVEKSGLTLVLEDDVFLYTEEYPDKTFVVLQN